jgi:hypothetical protein
MDTYKPIDPTAMYGGTLYKGLGFSMSAYYNPVIMIYNNGLLAIHGKNGILQQAPINEVAIKIKPLSGMKIKINGKHYFLRHFVSSYGQGPSKISMSEYQKGLIEHVKNTSKVPLLDSDIDAWHKLFLETNLPNTTPKKLVNSGRTARIFYWSGTVILVIVCFLFLCWYAVSSNPQ